MKARTPEARALQVCTIALAIGKGLPRSHSKRCGHCKRVAEQIKLAVGAEAKLWFDTLKGEREMMSDYRVAVVSEFETSVVFAERKRANR